jgi:hypothetical protein
VIVEFTHVVSSLGSRAIFLESKEARHAPFSTADTKAKSIRALAFNFLFVDMNVAVSVMIRLRTMRRLSIGFELDMELLFCIATRNTTREKFAASLEDLVEIVKFI